MTDDELDRRFRALSPIDPPRALQARILADVGVSPELVARTLAGSPERVPSPTLAGSPERVPSPTLADAADRVAPPPLAPAGALVHLRPRWRRAAVVSVLALAAAALLFVRPPSPSVADPSQLVPRGVGEVSPAIELRVAVKHGNVVDRLVAGKAYGAGDTLLFRVSTSTPMEITLFRDAELLYKGQVPAGDTDLPVGYALEPGQGPARLLLEGGGAQATVALPGVLP